MEKLFISFVLCIRALGCKKEIITDYYLLEYTLPVVHEKSDGRFSTSKASTTIKVLPTYESDSIVISTERKRAEDWIKQLPYDRERRIENAKESNT